MTVDESGVDMFVYPENEYLSEENPVNTVINNLQLSKSYFAPQYLFALDEYRLLAIDDHSSITIAKYWEHHRTVCWQFKEIDSALKSIWESKTCVYLHRQS